MVPMSPDPLLWPGQPSASWGLTSGHKQPEEWGAIYSHGFLVSELPFTCSAWFETWEEVLLSIYGVPIPVTASSPSVTPSLQLLSVSCTQKAGRRQKRMRTSNGISQLPASRGHRCYLLRASWLIPSTQIPHEHVTVAPFPMPLSLGDALKQPQQA